MAKHQWLYMIGVLAGVIGLACGNQLAPNRMLRQPASSPASRLVQPQPISAPQIKIEEIH